MTADRTVNYVYGPEHQRVRQSLALSGNGTSAYFAGSTWYLNGEDSLGLTYEREERNNGLSLQRHFLSAGGFVFAQITKESGTGAGPNASRYLHYDHQGSIAAISDATGTVVERLAYDPWGKRRSSNGVADPLDALVGVNTDRGYTLREHIDEVGVINMNGRVYDPLIGRFMSADPINQAPCNLKSFNRYSYVWNNPLKLWDPNGYQTVGDDEGETSDPNIGDTVQIAMAPVPALSPGFAPPAMPGAAPHPSTTQSPYSEDRPLATPPTPGTRLSNLSIPEKPLSPTGLFGFLMDVARAVGLNMLADALSASYGVSQSQTVSPPVPGAIPGEKTKGRTTNWGKPGGFAQANDDFDALNPGSVRPLPNGGRTGVLEDGRKVNVRPDSNDGRPTLEIQDGKSRDKVRYD